MFYKVVDAILIFGGKDTTFPRNFQGFWEKCRDDDNENEGFNIKSPSEIASQKQQLKFHSPFTIIRIYL